MREKRIHIAAHEAGHAVVAQLLGYPVVRISVSDVGGHTRYHVGDRHAPLCEAAICLAGPIALDHMPRPAAEPSALA